MTTQTVSGTTTNIGQIGLTGSGRMMCDGTDPMFGDWRDDLARDGYAVVKGAVPQDRALSYGSRMLGLLESL